MSENTIATEVAELAVEAATTSQEEVKTETVPSETSVDLTTKMAEAVNNIASEEKPVENTVSELDLLKAKIAEYEKKVEELTNNFSSVEEEANLYRPKKDLLQELEGLNPKAIKALKHKDLWDILDSTGITEDELYNKIAAGRPKLSPEEMIERKFKEMDEARKMAEQVEIKSREQKAYKTAISQVTDWLNIKDTKTIPEELADAHEILKFAKEDNIIDVETTLLDMVMKSGVSYAEAAKTLAKVLEEKALKMTLLKSLDKQLSTRYKTSDPTASKIPEVAAKGNEVIKTLGSKIEDAPKVALEAESITGKESFEEMIAKAKKQLTRKPTNIR